MNSRSWRAYYLTQGFDSTLALLPVERIVFSGKSEFQRIEVVDFETLGRGLVLDGLVQVVECDEFVYHESLVQTALCNCEDPEDVVIIGGGDGGALREVLRCRTVKKATVVDIDETVVEVSKKHLKAIHKGAFENKRARVVFGDGRKYLNEREKDFDAIVVDVTDPIPSGPSLFLYSREFYGLAKRALRPGGVLVTQASPFQGRQFLRVVRTLKSVFGCVLPFHAYVSSFADDWGFSLATNGRSPAVNSPAEIDQWIGRQIRGKNRYLNGNTYRANMSLSPLDEERLARKVKPITDSEVRLKSKVQEASSPWIYQ